MEITIAIALYVLGCVLAYGRHRATFENEKSFSFCYLSWIWFLVGALVWFKYERRDGVKFLKF